MSTKKGPLRIMFALRRSAIVLLALIVALGCTSESGEKGRAIDETTAERLVGSWDVTLRLERPLSLSMDARKLPLSVTGVISFLEDRSRGLSFDQMDGPTHIGVYEIALGSLGFPRRESDVIPSLAARTIPNRGAAASLGHDSVYIVINPETPRQLLRLAGTFDSDSVSGVWVAESFLGGGGTFVLRRRGNK